jgi:hypothetical protein
MGKRSLGLVCDVTVIVVCLARYLGEYESLCLIFQEMLYSDIDPRDHLGFYTYTRWDGGPGFDTLVLQYQI